MSNKSDQAVAIFSQGFNCAQAVLGACGPECGLDRELGFRVAGAFGAGMGRMGLTCGAVTGAFMALGLAPSPAGMDKRQAYEHRSALVREFTKRFKKRHGSIACRDLVGVDLSTPEGMEKAMQSGCFKTLCPKLVNDAVEIIEEMAKPV